MLENKKREQCCGCSACYSICPGKAISMMPDKEGFFYPSINKEKCINCGLCEKICPVLTKIAEPKNESVHWALQYTVEEKRVCSTAGGAFSLVADYILENDGVVFGVGYDEKMVVCHKYTESSEGLIKMRGSKYVQSYLGDTFTLVKAYVEKGKPVLFVGTPCQVHGLKNYIGEHDNLYTIDLLCLGVSSPMLFGKWIEYVQHKFHGIVSDVQFRNKRYGYATTNVRVYLENGKEYDQKYETRNYAKTFFDHYNVRPSCYECNFREIPRVSDFTIGDCTSIGLYSSEMDDDKGTTNVWAHTGKAKTLLRMLQKRTRNVVIKSCCNNVIGGHKRQVPTPQDRENFFDDAVKLDFEVFINKWEPNNLKGRLGELARPIVNKCPPCIKKYIFGLLRKYKTKKFSDQVKKVNQE